MGLSVWKTELKASFLIFVAELVSSSPHNSARKRDNLPPTNLRLRQALKTNH